MASIAEELDFALLERTCEEEGEETSEEEEEGDEVGARESLDGFGCMLMLLLLLLLNEPELRPDCLNRKMGSRVCERERERAEEPLTPAEVAERRESPF